MSENKVIDAEVKVTDVNPETQQTQTPAQQPAETQTPTEVKKEGIVCKVKNFAKKHKTGLLMGAAAAAGAAVAIVGMKFKKNNEPDALPYYPDEDDYEDDYDEEYDEDEYDDDEDSDDSETTESEE